MNNKQTGDGQIVKAWAILFAVVFTIVSIGSLANGSDDAKPAATHQTATKGGHHKAGAGVEGDDKATKSGHSDDPTRRARHRAYQKAKRAVKHEAKRVVKKPLRVAKREVKHVVKRTVKAATPHYSGGDSDWNVPGWLCPTRWC